MPLSSSDIPKKHFSGFFQSTPLRFRFAKRHETFSFLCPPRILRSTTPQFYFFSSAIFGIEEKRGNCGVETDNAFPGIFAAKNLSSTVFPVYASFILISFRGENKKRFGKKGKKVGVKGIPRFSVDQTNRVGLCVHLSLAQTIPFYDVEERPAR